MNNNYEIVRSKFDDKRNAAIDAAESKKAELRKLIPDFAKIESEISENGIKLIRFMQDIGTEHSKDILDLKAQMHDLKEKRNEILNSAGYSPDCIRPHFDCEKCEDTGLIGVDICECFKKALRLENYLSSGLGKALVRQRFENFDISLYPDDCREQMKNVYDTCLEYAAEFSHESPNLLFIGGTGLGKTHLSSAIAMKVLDKGFEVVYDTAQNIFSVFEKNRFNRDDRDTPKYTEADLLIIDDLGAEFGGNMADGTLYNILNARMNSELPTIISTNLTMKDIRAKYDSRIVSRLLGQSGIIQFTGRDVRMEKLTRR